MYIYDGKLFLKKEHIQPPRNESDYLKQRYHAIAIVFSSKNNIIREKAARDLKIGMRQFRRLLKSYQDEAIPGLRYKSKRPLKSPNNTTQWLEDLFVKVREKKRFYCCFSYHKSSLTLFAIDRWNSFFKYSEIRVFT